MARRPFKYVSDEIELTILSALFFVGVIYFTGRGGGGQTNTLIWFASMVIFPTILGVGTGAQSDEDTVKVTLGAWGFNIEDHSFSILMAILGLGIGAVFFGIFSRPASVLAEQGASVLGLPASTMATVAQPLYMPLSTNVETSTVFATGLSGSILYYVVVAFFEEAISVIFFKNTTNYLVGKLGWTLATAGTVGLIVSALIWGAAHFSAWGGIGVGSIMMAFLFRIIFWAPFILSDVIGVITPSEFISWEHFVVWGGFTSHWIWDVLIHAQNTGALSSIFIFNASVSLQAAVIGTGLSVAAIVGIAVLEQHKKIVR